MLGRRLQWSRSRIGALTLVAGLGNTSFVGYPLIEALRGQEGLAYAVIADQGGCFIALAVGGVIVASIYRSEEHTSELQSLMRISYAVFCLKKKKHHIIYSTLQLHIIYTQLPTHDTYIYDSYLLF